MDNAFIADGVLAAILAAGALIGAKRGLFKSLMGLLTVVLAFAGAVWLSGILTEPVTDFIAPKVEDAVVERFSGELEKASQPDGAYALGGVSELLEQYGVSGDALGKIWEPFASAVGGATERAKERAADAFRGAVSASVRSLVRGAVHTALTLILYLVLLLALKLLTRLLDPVFDLPVLGAANSVGGAAFGLLEAALLLFAALRFLSLLDAPALAACADGSRLLPLFLDHSPVEWLSALMNPA